MQTWRLLFTALLCAVVSLCNAQSPSAVPLAWESHVSRLIPIADTAQPALPIDSTLTTQLCRLVRQGKLAAYQNYTSKMTSRLSEEQVSHIFFSSDTIEIEDPVTGQKFQKVRIDSLDYHIIKYWRVLEYWTFDDQAGTMKIQIAGIAPTADVYDEYNTFRAHRSVFWLRWADVSAMVNAYGKRHPGWNILSHYQQAVTGMPATADRMPWVTGYNTHEIRLQDTSFFNNTVLRDEADTPALTEQMMKAVMDNKCAAYKLDKGQLNPMSKAEVITAINIKIDTVVINDPINNQTIYKIVKRDFPYDTITRYKLLQQWTTDVDKGTLSIRINAIAPEFDIYDNDGVFQVKDLFWLKYNDARSLIDGISRIYPGMSLNHALWKSVFN